MLKRLFNEQPSLMWAGVVSFVLFLVTAVLVFIDPIEILGINRWIKPMKFFVSIAIFLWTMAVYFDALPERRNTLVCVTPSVSWTATIRERAGIAVVGSNANKARRMLPLEVLPANRNWPAPLLS